MEADGAACDWYKRGRETTVDLIKRVAPQAKATLTDAQRRKLPTIVTSYLDPLWIRTSNMYNGGPCTTS